MGLRTFIVTCQNSEKASVNDVEPKGTQTKYVGL